MVKSLWLKLIQNKTNKQFLVTLPKKKLKIFGGDKIPKKIKMRIEDLKW